MKIAQVVCVFPPYKGGIGTVASNYAQILSKKGFNVVTFTLGKSKQKNVYNGDISKVMYLNPLIRLGNAAFTPNLYKQLKDFDKIIFHYPFFGADIIIFILKLLHPKIHIIIHYHMDVFGLPFYYYLLGFPSFFIRRSLFKVSNQVVCASFDYVKNSKISKIFNKYNNKFYEVPFGVNTEKFTPKHDKSSLEIKRILFVGGMDKAHFFKGVNILLKACSLLNFENWNLDLIGEGELRKSYEKMSKKLLIDDKVTFHGAVENDKIIRYFQSSNLFILPSINNNEAFGIVLIEAMSCGVPVIATNVPGVRSVFRNNEHGYLVEAGNYIELSHAIDKFFQNEKIQQEMSIKVRSYAVKKYNFKIYSQSICNIIAK